LNYIKGTQPFVSINTFIDAFGGPKYGDIGKFSAAFSIILEDVIRQKYFFYPVYLVQKAQMYVFFSTSSLKYI
jgi:hypothetical protein